MRRLRECRVIFDGQSRNWSPSNSKWGRNIFLGYNFPRLLMAGRHLPWEIVAVTGKSFTWLSDNWAGRADIHITSLEPTIYILTGGYSDYASEGDSGETAYQNAGILADKARDAGAAYVICQTTLPSTNITGLTEASRVEGNGKILDDLDGYFDDTVNLEVDPLNDPVNGPYYDGTHQWGVGNQKIVELLGPKLDAAIAAVTA